MEPERLTGTITIIHPTKAYGFIQVKPGAPKIFFDWSEIQTPETGYKSKVSFRAIPQEKYPDRLRAVDIRKAA